MFNNYVFDMQIRYQIHLFYKCFMLFFNILPIFMQWKNMDEVVHKQADSAAPYLSP